MNFKKISEKVIRPEGLSYFLVREFHFDESSRNPIADFMQTRFFLWQEEFRDKVPAATSTIQTYVDWNFHGLYDIQKLRPENFIKVEHQEFKLKFLKFIIGEIGPDPELNKIESELNKLLDIDSEFFLIEDLTEEYLHENTVFVFFLSGFKLNKKKKKLTAIEFGLD